MATKQLFTNYIYFGAFYKTNKKKGDDEFLFLSVYTAV